MFGSASIGTGVYRDDTSYPALWQYFCFTFVSIRSNFCQIRIVNISLYVRNNPLLHPQNMPSDKNNHGMVEL